MLIEIYEDDFEDWSSLLTDDEINTIKKLCHQVEQGWYSLDISDQVTDISKLSSDSLLFLFRMTYNSAVNECREQVIERVIEVVKTL